MQIRFDENDFARSYNTSMQWSPDLVQQNRWEWVRGPEEDGDSQDLNPWSFAYWVTDWPCVVLMRSWLDEHSHPYVIVFDLAANDYVILTDYPASWGHRTDTQAAMSANTGHTDESLDD